MLHRCTATPQGFFPEDHPNFVGVFWVNISTPYCGETVTIADKYLFAGPVFNDVTTVGFTHPIVNERLVEVQMDHVSVGSSVGKRRMGVGIFANVDGRVGF